jgi:hypothetical protein
MSLGYRAGLREQLVFLPWGSALEFTASIKVECRGLGRKHLVGVWLRNKLLLKDVPATNNIGRAGQGPYYRRHLGVRKVGGAHELGFGEKLKHGLRFDVAYCPSLCGCDGNGGG